MVLGDMLSVGTTTGLLPELNNSLNASIFTVSCNAYGC